MSRFVNAINAYFAEPEPPMDSVDKAVFKIMLGRGNLLKFNLNYSPDKLIRNKDFDVIDEMRRDDSVKAAIGLKMTAPIAVGWHVEPASDSPNDIRNKDFILANFERLEGSLEKRMKQFTLALPYGFSVNEIILATETFGDYGGKWMLDRLVSHAPHNLGFCEGDDGFVNGIKQQGPESAGCVPLAKFVYYVWQGDFENPWGRTDLEAAYSPWWSKDVSRRMWNIYIERFAFDKWFVKYGDGKQKDIAEEIATKMPETIAMAFPQGLDVDNLGTEGRGSSVFKEAIDTHDQAIARSILKQTLAQGEGERVGSLAMARVHQDTFLLEMATVAQDIEEECMTEQIIKPLIDLNFGVQQAYPRFCLSELFPEAPKEFADVYLDLIKEGGIEPTKADEDRIRDLSNLPPRVGDNPPPGRVAAPATTEPVEAGAAFGAEQRHHDHPFVPLEKYVSHFAAGTRALNKIEKRANIGRIEDRLNTVEEQATTQLIDIVEIIKAKMLAQVKAKFFGPGLAKAANVNKLSVPMLSSFKKVIEAAGQTLFKGAGDDLAGVVKLAAAEFPEEGALRFAAANPGGLTFKQQTAAFKQRWAARSQAVASEFGAEIEKDIRNVLLKAIENGEGQAETSAKLNAVFEKWLPSADGLAPGRLGTIVRTNMSTAYNQGRLIASRDPDLKGFIKAYQYVAVMDDVTTDICIGLDGDVFPADSPELDRVTPPNHFNCRSIMVEIVKGDDFETTPSRTRARDIARIPDGFK